MNKSKNLLVYRTNQLLSDEQYQRIKNALEHSSEKMDCEILVCDSGSDVDLTSLDLIQAVREQTAAVKEQTTAVMALAQAVVDLVAEEDPDDDELLNEQGLGGG